MTHTRISDNNQYKLLDMHTDRQTDRRTDRQTRPKLYTTPLGKWSKIGKINKVERRKTCANTAEKKVWSNFCRWSLVTSQPMRGRETRAKVLQYCHISPTNLCEYSGEECVE